MQFFFEPDLPKGTETLNEDESAHCIKVFRHKKGDHIGLLDGQGGLYKAVISDPHPKHTQFQIIDKKQIPPGNYSIHLAIAPTKNADRMEWLAEKLTEIGVSSITLIISQNSERRKYRTDRLQKKIINALKQSKNPYIPELKGPLTLDELLKEDNDQQKFIAYVDDSNPVTLKEVVKPNYNYLILIGPEGDFTKEELENCMNAGYMKVSLGNNVLRTETAGLVAVHSLHLLNT